MEKLHSSSKVFLSRRRLKTEGLKGCGAAQEIISEKRKQAEEKNVYNKIQKLDSRRHGGSLKLQLESVWVEKQRLLRTLEEKKQEKCPSAEKEDE